MTLPDEDSPDALHATTAGPQERRSSITFVAALALGIAGAFSVAVQIYVTVSDWFGLSDLNRRYPDIVHVDVGRATLGNLCAALLAGALSALAVKVCRTAWVTSVRRHFCITVGVILGIAAFPLVWAVLSAVGEVIKAGSISVWL